MLGIAYYKKRETRHKHQRGSNHSPTNTRVKSCQSPEKGVCRRIERFQDQPVCPRKRWQTIGAITWPAARKTADVKRASPATQGRRESAGGQESGTRSPATCVKRQSALNTPAKLERTVFAEVKITLLTSKGELLTNHCGNILWINMAVEWISQPLNTSAWQKQGYFSSRRGEKQMRESESQT